MHHPAPSRRGRARRFLCAGVSTALLIFSLAGQPAPATTVGHGHVPATVSSGRASLVAPLPQDQHLRLTFNLPLRHQAELEDLLRQLYDPASPGYHQYLDNDEFSARFAPDQADVDAIVGWARAQGLEVTGVPTNRRFVGVEGTARELERALHIRLNTYQEPAASRRFFSTDREPSPALTVTLLKIGGLDNATPPQNHLSSDPLGAALASVAITGSGPGNAYLPSDMRAAYYGNGPLTGVGQTVAIFSFNGYRTDDLQLYYSSTGMRSTVPVNNVNVEYNGACLQNNGSGKGPCEDDEQILDIVNAIGMAPGLRQLLVYEGPRATATLNRIATDNIAKVISCSWQGGDFDHDIDLPIFLQFAAQGQTFATASGDWGAYGAGNWQSPAQEPYALLVGGTALRTYGAGGYLAFETAWTHSGGGNYGTIGIPDYQGLPGVINASNQGSLTLRNAPDIAAEADYDNPTVSNHKFLLGYGGTSFAAPRIAGFIALANEQAVTSGVGPLGFVNPALYRLGAGADYATTFHDVASGSNPQTQGSSHNVFNAVPGYDLVTGWGSPAGVSLINRLAGDFALDSAPSTLHLVPGHGTTSVISMVMLDGWRCPVTFSASGLPQGVGATFSPVYASGTSATSTLTLTAASSAPAAGPLSLIVVGSCGVVSHAAPLSLTVAASDFSLSATAVTLTPQGSAGSTVTVTSLNGFISNVQLQVSGLPPGVSAEFSNTGTSSASILTLSASAAARAGTATVTISGSGGGRVHTTTVSLAITDFALSVSSGSLSLQPGASASLELGVDKLNGFVSPVVFGNAGDWPDGSTISFSPRYASDGSTVTIGADPATPAGVYVVQLTALYGALTRSAPLTLIVHRAPADFSVTVAPNPLPVTQGGSTAARVTLTPTNGFAEPVDLAIAALPAGVSATFSPVATDGTSTLTVHADSGAAVGSAALAIGAVASSITHAASLTLSVLPASPDFSFDVDCWELAAGQHNECTVTVLPEPGFDTQQLVFSTTGLPSGIHASFGPIDASNRSILSLDIDSDVILVDGSWSFLINASAGGLTRALICEVFSGAPFVLMFQPTPISTAAGSGGVTGVDVLCVNGYIACRQQLSMSIAGLPPGAVAWFDYPLQSLPEQFTNPLHISTDASTPPGRYVLPILVTPQLWSAESYSVVLIVAPHL